LKTELIGRKDLPNARGPAKKRSGFHL